MRQMREGTGLLSFLVILSLMSGPSAILYGAHWNQSLAFTYDNGLGDTMPYRLFVPPDYDSERAYPLVIFLHGAGERGTNNISQVSVNIDSLISATQGPLYTSFLAAPQTTDTWESDRSANLVDGILTEIEENYGVDSSRLYITGLSLGGFGTFNQLHYFPERFAAAAPLCGGVRSVPVIDMATVIKDIPTWVFHGAADSVVHVSMSRNIVDRMRAAGGNPLYTEYPNMGHNIWSRVYADDNNEFYPWMFSQSLDGLLVEPMLHGLHSPPDFNGDSQVNIKDLLILIEHWEQNEPSLDIAPIPAGNGTVDALDLEVMMRFWNQDVNDLTLLHHWPLDEAQGDIAYNSAVGNNGTLLGDPIWQPDGGMFGGAVGLDGLDDCVSTGPALNPADGPFSALVWIKGGAPGQVILSQEGGWNWLMADTVDGSLRTELRTPATTGRGALPPGPPLISPAVITDGDWHRVAFVRDAISRVLYVDGIEVARDTAENLESADGGLYIGAGSGLEPGTFWSGLIDDVRIYNRAVKP